MIRLGMPSLAGLLVILEACSAPPAPRAPRRLPEAAARVLASPDRFELLSLDPVIREDEPGEVFHEWRVLGRTAIDEPSRQTELRLALEKGIADSGPMALCFAPRHGVRATAGADSVDLVICFECLQLEVRQGGSVLATVATTRSPEATLDRALDQAGVKRKPRAPD